MSRDEAREELRKKLEGYMTDSIGAALEYLDSGDADDLLDEAGLLGVRGEKVLQELTGVSVQ